MHVLFRQIKILIIYGQKFCRTKVPSSENRETGHFSDPVIPSGRETTQTVSLRHLSLCGDVNLSVPGRTTGNDPSDHVPVKAMINPRPYRGGGVGATPPPLRFFADSKKTAARSAAGFWATLWGKPCAIFGKKKLTGSGQVTEL